MNNIEIFILNKTYNKLFLYATYNLLKTKSIKEAGFANDPIAKKKVKVNRSIDFMHLWVKHFQELAPLLKNNFSIKKRNELIHLIFGQSIKSVLPLLYHWPSLEEVAIHTVKRDLEKHIKHIKQKGTYEIK